MIDAEDAKRLHDLLSGDGVAVIPTDTVYGLACNPESSLAVSRIYELKGRPAAKPSAVMFFDLDRALDWLPELGPRTRAALRVLLPGAVTLLLANPRGRFELAAPAGAAGAPELLGIRVPTFDGPLAALAGLPAVALQSSANLSGGHDPCRLVDVPAELREGAELTLDGGELPGLPSSVIDLSSYEADGRWHTVRSGLVPESEIRALLAGAC